MKSYSDLTKYPKLFENTYWGSFQVDKDTTQNEIIAHRNKFSEEFEVITFISSDRPRAGSKLFDHCELYKTKNGVIYITSPYDDVTNEAENYGFSA